MGHMATATVGVDATSGPGTTVAITWVAGPPSAHMTKADVVALVTLVPPASATAVHELTLEPLAGLVPVGSLG